MIQTDPRLLPRKRLEQLVAGLQVRMSSSSQQMAAELEKLKTNIKELEVQHEQELLKLEQDSKIHSDEVHTHWDEDINRCWDDAETRTFKAIFETKAREKAIITTARNDTEQVNNEAKNRVNEIEKRYAHAVETTGHKLDQFRQQLETVRRMIDKLQMDGQAALDKHSLHVPDKIDSRQADPSRDSQQALEQSKVAVVAAQQHVKRLENLPLSNLSGSIWWWLVCLVVLGAGIGIPMFIGQPLMISLVIGASAVTFVVLAAMLGVRPWLKKGAAAEYPKLRGLLELAGKYLKTCHELSVSETDAEINRLGQKRGERLDSLTAWHETQVNEIKTKADATLAALRAKAQEEKEIAASRLATGLEETNEQFQIRLDRDQIVAMNARQMASSRLSTAKADLEAQIEQLLRGGAHRLQVSTQKAIQLVQRNTSWCNQNFPNWSQLENPQIEWPSLASNPNLPLGTLDVNNCVKTDPSGGLVLERMQTPVLFSPLQDGYLVIKADPSSLAVKDLVRSLLVRALTTLPSGKTQLCIVDPPGLGRDFGWLMHLSDFDPTLVSHRVWTQPPHIARQLQNLASSAEDFIQQSLRNQYANIIEYNRDAGSLAEPFRILVWSSFPSGMDEQSWKALQSLLDTGARCGIIPILIIDPATQMVREQQEIVDRRGLHLKLTAGGQFEINSARVGPLNLKPEPTATDSQADFIVREIGRRALAASRVEVPLGNMVGTTEETRWQGDSSRSLEIPIGQSGVGRVHSMKLGVGTAQHAIIAGKTGSGKSSLLHALITSALMKYSPENLRLVLLDFKKGVEFQVYSDANIPHADIIGIESHREFGLSALEYVDDCLQRRGEMFRKAGVQDIASWNAVHPENSIPRMMVVVDEFQELFVEDDKLSQAASLILDRIVRQGRSFGVHAVLSSQTLVGSYSLPRTTLGQMAVRIALQCDPSDAQVIFADDNPAATRLKYPGQAVYNDAGGRIEGNQPMQIGWLDKATQVGWFKSLPSGYQNRDATTNRLGRTVVFDGNRPATWEPAQADLAISRAKQEVNPDAIWCVCGESVSISPAVVFPLINQAGRNMLLVGGEDAMAAATLHSITSSFVKAISGKGEQCRVVCLQGAKPTDARALQLPNRWQQLPCETSLFDLRTIDEGLAQVHQVLQQRISGESDNLDRILLNIVQLGRLRSLRREDDFSFNSSGTTPDKMLEEILRDGPSHNVHVLAWAESYSTVNRWLSRNAVREFEIRLLMQMSANDSSNLVDSVAASKLGDHVMLLYDEATGHEQKFRPYANEGLDQIGQWVGLGSTLNASVTSPNMDGDAIGNASVGLD